MYNRDGGFFRLAKPLLEARKTIEFPNEFYVEKLPGSVGLKERLKITRLLVEGFENLWD
jgi:hypothetical protein